MLDEESNLTLVICTFQIDMARNEVGAAAAGLVLQAFVNELLDVHNDADEGDLLLFDTLSD